MGRLPPVRLLRRQRLGLAKLDAVIDRAYGAPAWTLDNKENPLDEAIYIILSFQTNLTRFQRVWLDLRESFPTWESLAAAPLSNVSNVLRAGGLQEQKAKTIKRLLKSVNELTGGFSLDLLHDMNDEAAETFLIKLPGLSWKGARCVLLYSLNRHVFPVDGNTFRILKRVGLLPSYTVYRRKSLHDSLQEGVAPGRRRSFHINLVVHGQRTCVPRVPRCRECAVQSMCSMADDLAKIEARPSGRLQIPTQHRKVGP